MSRVDTLKSLEIVLESFLDRMIRKKSKRLVVLDGLNRLDDLARGLTPSSDPTEELGKWFARHNRLANEQILREGDRRRIGDILSSIRSEYHLDDSTTPAARKISEEIGRWTAGVPAQTESRTRGRLVLKRGAEGATPEPTAERTETDSIRQFEALVKRMQVNYPGLNVAYSYSPPFRMLNSDEDAEVISNVKESGVKILFVGLGCPKQERWMAEHRDKIPAVMLGVGAAFNIHAGIKKQAPTWLQRAGLEWLYRFLQEPGRLWRRYLFHNPRFVVLAIADLLGILNLSHR